MTLCNATHPQTEELAAAGVRILPCQLENEQHGDRHVFEAESIEPVPAIWEPWQPQVGEYVRIAVSPECEAYHARGHAVPLYGRVEFVDRNWDDPAAWALAGLTDNDDLAEMLEHARTSRGHYYYVQDALDGGHITLVDENCCALELTQVPAEVAITAIEGVRAALAALPPQDRFLTRVGALALAVAPS